VKHLLRSVCVGQRCQIAGSLSREDLLLVISKVMRKSGFAWLCACAILACDSPTEPDPEPELPRNLASLNLREGVVRLVLSDSAQLVVEARDSAQQLLSTAVVTWTADDPQIASVDANGKVKAMGIGWTMIRVESGEFSDYAWVGVSLRFKQVSAGLNNACGITIDDAMYCWGTNRGIEIYRIEESATPVRFSTDARAVATGWEHGCWIKSDQTVWCWGRDHHGQLGDGATGLPGNGATQVLLPQPLVSINASQHHTCGVTADERVFCWGINDTGEVGIWPDPDGRSTPGCSLLCRQSPVEVPGVRLRMVSAGLEHTCGLDAEGAATCWGANETGQLGIGVIGDTLPPQRLSTPLRFKTIDAGYSRTCAISTSDELYCWGQGVSTPARVETGEKFQSVSVMSEMCAVSIAGMLYCMRENVMTPLASDVVFTTISRNSNMGCALSVQGAAYCMAYAGNTGSGLPSRNFPVMVAPPGPVPFP
jgi:hypothetical protein